MKKILIVGAGPTGLTAAVELARQGIIPDIIEKHTEPSELSRAVGILPGSIKILSRSGADLAIRKEAVKIHNAVIHNGQDPALHLNMDAVQHGDRRILCLAQSDTEEAIAKKLTEYGGKVLYGHRLTDIKPKDGRAQVHINDGRAKTYDNVIGADGVRSTVRQKLGIDYQGYDLDDEWSIADVMAKDWPGMHTFAGFFNRNGKVVIVLPIGRNRLRLISNTPDALAALPVPIDVTHINRSGTFQISVRQATSYQAGSIFLAGDAAHCHSPVGGRGMNLGIADAADLAARIVAGETDGYTAARHPIGAQVIHDTERLRKFIMSDNPMTLGVRSAAFKLIDKVPFLNRQVVSQLLNF